MMKLIICNAFSFSMLDREKQAGRDALDGVRVPRPLDESALAEFCRLIRDGKIEMESAVGHPDTASIFESVLGFTVPVNRVSVKLSDPNTRAIIGQYAGPRLPEGARFEWWIV